MTLPLELGGIRDPAIRRAFEQVAQQFPVVAGGGGGGGAPSGPAGGDLGSVYPNPTVVKAQSGFTVGGLAVILAGDAALTNARAPTAHATTHQPGGSDQMAVDAAAATGSLRTLGTSATSAAAGNDSRLSDSRVPSGAAGGDLAGVYPNPGIATGVIVNTDVNAAAAIDESKLNLATDAAAGTGSRRTLGTTATSAAAGNRGLPAGGTSGQALTKNTATDYDVGWSTVSSGSAGTMTLDTWHTVGAAGEPAFTNSWVNFAGGYQSAGFTKLPNGRVQLRGAIKTGAITTSAFTLPAGYRPPATLEFSVAQGANIDVTTAGLVQVFTANAFVDLSVIEFDTETVSTLFGWAAVPRQAADVTSSSTTLTDTDLVFSFAANSTYLIDLYLLATSAAATTGYQFAFDVSAAVTTVAMTFEHQLATAGTLTGGDSIADAAARGISSGVPTASSLNPILGKGLLISTANAGTCRLQFAPEVAASATFKAGSVMRVMKAA